MSNNIFSLDPTTHQSSLSKVKIGSTDDSSLIVLGKVTKVYYHQGTLDFKLTSGVSSIVSDGSGNGTGSARIPLDYFGQDGEGRTYGHYRPVKIGDTVAIAYLNGHKTSPIVIGVYAPNGEQYEAISPTLFDSGDDTDEYIAETGLAEQHVHHSGQISYRSGSGRLFESLNGYSYMVIDDNTSQDYSQLYVDLSLVPYSAIDGETREPQQEKAGDWLLVHEDNPNGLNADNHITRFYVNKSGDFELVFTNTSFAGVSTVLHMDKNGMKLNKYIGHQSKKAGVARANEEDRTITADFDSAPTTVTFDLGETNEDRISLKSSSTVDSKEQATNLEVRTDGVYINDTKLFDSNTNSLAELSMFLDGGVLDFSKVTVKNFSGDNIEDGTIGGAKLKDKTVTANKLNISKLSDITSDMGILTSGSIQLNNGTNGSTGVSISGDPSSDPDILTPNDKAQLQQQLNALYSQCQALIDYGNSVNIDVSELGPSEQSLKDLTDWIFETEGNTKVDRPKIDEAITKFTALLETYRNKFTSQLNRKVAETANKANSIYQGSQEPDQANVKNGDLWLQTNSDGTSNIMQYTDSVWKTADLKGYHEAIVSAKKAQDAADKLPHNYYQATEPSGTQYNDGDLWYQNVSSTSDGKTKYNVYKWDISSKKWVQFIDNNANNNYVADSRPADPNDGDFWTDTDGTLKQYQNGEWKTIPTQGPQGVPGVSAKQQYIHIAYATSANGAENFSTTSFSGATYIGLLVDENEEDSKNYADYTWSLMKGADGTDGADGVPGAKGADGKTSYVHFAYANSSDGKNSFSKIYFDNALYIGTYTDFTEGDSDDYTKYTWSRLKGQDGKDGTDGKDGVPGANGEDGKTSYIHTAYANSADGSDSSFNLNYFTNALYIGIYTDFTEGDSKDHTKYTWSRLKGVDGSDGTDGVPGAKGADGKTSYVHFAYANSADGSGPSFNLTYFDNALYVGTYTDFTEGDSKDHTKYTWSRLKGDTGATGTGIDSTVVTYQASSSGTTVPSGVWTISVPKATEGQYVWTKTVIGYTDGTSSTSYSVGKIGETGTDGKDGADGKDGVGISSTVVTYQLSTSGSTEPTGTWSSTILSPTTANPYLWVRTVLTYSDGSTKTLYTISVKGDTGDDGVAGKDGVGLSSTTVTYQASTSGITEPTGTWSSSVPTLTKGQYLWTKTIWAYTDGTSETGYSVAYVGKDGNDGNDGVAGKDGVGISSTTITYQGSTDGTTAPTGTWSTSIPTVSAGEYLWTKTVWSYTDGTNETGYSVAKMGETGATGANGIGVSSTSVTYQASDSGTTTPTNTWSSTVPPVSPGQYLWTKTVWTYTNSTTATGYSVSHIGSNGAKGEDGVGVSSSTVTYQLSSSGTTTPTGTWSSSILAQTTALPYLWTKTLITYTDNTTTTMYSVSAKGDTGPKGDPGNDGARGPKGEDGISTYVWIKYATSSHGDDISDSPEGATYIGIATGKDSPNESRSKGDYNWTKIKGDDGAPGAKGADGKTPYVHIAYADSADGNDGFYVGGGVNLATGTDKEYTMGYGIPNTVWQDGYAYLKLPTTITNLINNEAEILPQDPHTFSYNLTPGQEYTQTIWFETDATVKDLSVAQITWFTGAGHDLQSATIINLGGNRYKLYSTYKWPGKSDNNLRLFDIYNLNNAFDLSTGTYLKFGKLMLEEGTVSHGWSPAPSESYPTYMGTYVDYTQDSSYNPATYRWTLLYDKSKKRNFTTKPTTPYNVGDTWTQSGATYFCTQEKISGAFDASDWKMQQLNIHSLDDDVQANIKGTKNLLMVDDIIYYSNPALDSTNTYNEGYQFDYTSADTTYVFQVQAKSTVNGDYVNMYPAWGSAYSQSEDKTSQVTVTTSPSVSNQTSTFNSSDSNVKLALTTDWVTYTCTITGTWDKGSVLTALLGRVYNSETKGTVAFRNVKLVAGNAITDYTSDDSITVAQGSNYWDSTTLQHNSSGTNLIVQSTLSSGYVSGSDGSIVGSDQDFNTDYIPASGLSTVTISSPDYTFTYDSNSRLVMYDDDKKFLGAQDLYPTTTLSQTNVAFIRISINFVDHGGTLGHLSDWLSTHRYKLEKGSVATPWSPNPSESDYDSWPPTGHYTPWYPISEGQRVFLTHYDYPAYPGTPNSASVEFADSNHNFISNGTNNSQGSSSLNGSNSSFISPQSLGGVYYNERMLKISIASEAYTSGTYQDLYIKTSGLLQSKLALYWRGTTVATFDPYSGQRVDTKYWDTWATVDNANALVNYLNSIANQDLVVAIATQDSFIQDSNDFQIASQNLCTVLQSMGLPSSYAPADLRGRVAFAFVGHTKAYQGTTDKALVSSSKGENQVSTLTAYVSNGHISSANNTGLVSQNATAKTTSSGVNLVTNTSTDIVIDATNSTTNNWAFAMIYFDKQPKLGDVLTISAEGTLTGTGALDEYQVILYDKDTSRSRSQAKFLKAGQRDSVTLSLDNLDGNGDTILLIYAGHSGDTVGKKNVVHHLMVEEGTVAHDWSPNPSDSDYASWLQTQYQGPLVAYANAPAKTAYFRAGYSFSTDEINRVHFMVTVDKLSTNYSSSIADVSSNAVRKDVSYRGVTLNDNGLTATAGDTQVIVNSTNGFEIKAKDDQTNTVSNVFSVDTSGNVHISGSTTSKANISAVDFTGKDLTLTGALDVTGSITAANKTLTIDPNGMTVSPPDGGSVTISQGGLTIVGTTVGTTTSNNQDTIYGINDSLVRDAGLFATKDKTGATKTLITSSGSLLAQGATIYGDIAVENLRLFSKDSSIMFGNGFKIDGSGAMTITTPSSISKGTYSDGVIEGSELDIGTAYHSKLSNADKYRYHVSNIGETTFGMSQDLGLMSSTQGLNESYLSLNNAWTQGQLNFRGTGSAPNNAIRALGVTSDIYTDSYGWKHRFSAPVWGASDVFNTISIWDQNFSGTIANYSIGYTINDSITNTLNKQIPSPGWGGSDTLGWTLSTVEFPSLSGSLFRFGSAMDLYPAQNQDILLTAGETYVFGAYIWHCGLHGGAKVSIGVSASESASSMQSYDYIRGSIVNYQQSGYSICTYTPSSNVYVHRIYVEAGVNGSTQGYDYGVPLSVTDPFVVPLNQFTSKLFGGGLDTLTSFGGLFGMPYPHLDSSQHGVLGLMRADNLTAGDKVVVSVPINYESGAMANFPQVNLGIAKPGNDDIYTSIDGELQPLMPGYYTYDFYFVWQDEYKNYINNNLVQLNLISEGIGSGEKAYVVSVDSVRMGIFVGTPTTSSTNFVNEYQAKFSPLGSLQLSHISNVGANGYTIAGQTQLTSEGLEINSSFSTSGSDYGEMHISINGKSGISIGGSMNYGNSSSQTALSFYGYAPYKTLLENTIEPQYNVAKDGAKAACGIWFDSYGNVHGYDSSAYWNMESPSGKSHLGVPLQDGYSFSFALSSPSGYSLAGSGQYADNQVGSNNLQLGLVHFYNVNSGYVNGYYPAFYTGSGDQLAGIAFGDGYVIIFGNRNKNNNLWSFPQGTSDGHTSNSGSVEQVTPNHPFS